MNKERLEEIAYNVGISLDGEKALMSSDDYDFLYNYALEQAERVEEMGKVEYALQEMYRQERQYNERLEKENQRLKQALEYIQRAIYTQHCTKNHKWNTEFEKGQISGLIQASNIVKKATENSGNTARQALEGESDA